MSYVSDGHRFRKTIAGVCMIGAPVLFLLSALTAPGFDADEATAVGLIAGDADAFATSQMLLLAGWALFIGVVMSLMHMLREKGAGEGNLGGALAVVGTIAAIAQCGFALALWKMAETDQAQAASMLTAFNDSTLPALIVFFLPLGVTVGGIVLSWALYRLHFVPAWMAAMIGGSGVLFAIGSMTYSEELFIAASAVALAGFGALGLTVLNESVEDWEHTPEFHGIGIGR